MRYYQSTDSMITTGDTEVGTDSVSRLDASESGDESVSVTAPSTSGTYYYGACVEAVSDESDATNNCSVAVTVVVGAAPAPDLTVSMFTADNSSPVTGQYFTVNATVNNQGNGSSSSTTLRYYRSTDATITTSDAIVPTAGIPGHLSVEGLSPSGSEAKSAQTKAPSTLGTYYYGACVDAVTGESDTTNNCSAAVTVTVLRTNRSPQLTGEVDDVVVELGESITVNLSGLFTDPDGDEIVSYGFSNSTSGILVGSVNTRTGILSLSAIAVGETTVAVNARDSNGQSGDTEDLFKVTVVAGAALAPDLVVDTPSASDSSPTAGASFTLNATVRNQGSGSSSSTTLRYYRSADAIITTSDTAVGTDSVSGLSASGSSDESISLTAPSDQGAYYYGACVDSVSDESDTTNNCSAAVTVTVGAAPAPDLIVSTFTVRNSSPVTGQYFTMDVTVNNQGNGSSESTTLRYFRSTDATITTSDASISLGGVPGFLSVDGLSPSGSVDKSASTPAPSTPGTYYYGACVGTVTGESDTTNNCSPAATVTVQAAAPDLVVDTPTVSYVYVSSLTAGDSFTLSFTVRNQGNWSSGPITLRYYRSTDAEFGDDDTLVGTQRTDTEVYSDGERSFTSETIIAHRFFAPSSDGRVRYPYISIGTYYYIVCVDQEEGESDTMNNCSSGVAVTATSPTTFHHCIVGYVLTPLDKCLHRGTLVAYGEVDAFNSGLGVIYFYSDTELDTITRSISGSGPGNRRTSVYVSYWGGIANLVVKSILTSAGNERITELSHQP